MTAVKSRFEAIQSALYSKLKVTESLALSLTAEDTQFVRFNDNKIRQTGCVQDANVSAKFFVGHKSQAFGFSLSSDNELNIKNALALLEVSRADVLHIPEDPYLVAPENHGNSHSETKGELLPAEDVAQAICGHNSKLTGIYVSGEVIRAQSNSLGQSHWFSTESFHLDYSLFHASGKAIKSSYAGTHWSDAELGKNLAHSTANLQALDMPVIELKPGKYRAYLAPAAVGEMISMFNWHGVSESELQQSESAFCKMRTEGIQLSEMFSLSESFTQGRVPRFNDEGKLAPLELKIFDKGKLTNALISARTAKEYGVVENGARDDEGMRSAVMSHGILKREDVLMQLGTGVYLSDLHYLNWSDVPGARVTGMTRYAPMWVENGVIKGPIKDMRFDDTLFSVFGSSLESVTDFREFSADTGTYFMRSVGGSMLCGMLLKEFNFTL